MKPKLDKYDREIKRLTRHPEQIPQAWMYFDKRSVLFKPVSGGTGCPTLISDRYYENSAPTEAITMAMQKDKILNNTASTLKVKHLERFAYWQRICDKTFAKQKREKK